MSYSNKMVYGKRNYGRIRRKRTMRKVKSTPFKRVNTRRLVAKEKTKSLVKLIKGVTLKQAETCYRSRKVQSFSVNHNTGNGFHVWDETIPVAESLFPTQGHTDGNRKGDEIITQGVRLRMVLNVPYDRRNTIFKVFWIPYNNTQGNPFNMNEFTTPLIGNVMLDPIQRDRWMGLKYLGSYSCRAKDLQGTDHHSILINRWITLRKKVRFQDDGSVQPSNLKERCALLILGYSTTGALTTDTVATNCQASMTLYYKDP